MGTDNGELRMKAECNEVEQVRGVATSRVQQWENEEVLLYKT